MELDKKIKVKKIFDCFSDFEEVKKYYGKEVYCADFIENFSNLKLYTDKKFQKFFTQECKPINNNLLEPLKDASQSLAMADLNLAVLKSELKKYFGGKEK